MADKLKQAIQKAVRIINTDIPKLIGDTSKTYCIKNAIIYEQNYVPYVLLTFVLFEATSFSRNVISPIHHFSESSCRQMSVDRIILLPNSEITETIYCRISFSIIGI